MRPGLTKRLAAAEAVVVAAAFVAGLTPEAQMAPLEVLERAIDDGDLGPLFEAYPELAALLDDRGEASAVIGAGALREPAALTSVVTASRSLAVASAALHREDAPPQVTGRPRPSAASGPPSGRR